jgi:hypothetical protein
MKISQLLTGVNVAMTNEEQHFVDRHRGSVRLNSLDDHNQWVAQNLIRKGVYAISKDNNTLIKNIHETKH